MELSKSQEQEFKDVCDGWVKNNKSEFKQTGSVPARITKLLSQNHPYRAWWGKRNNELIVLAGGEHGASM